jgi:hypothetical protein
MTPPHWRAPLNRPDARPDRLRSNLSLGYGRESVSASTGGSIVAFCVFHRPARFSTSVITFEHRSIELFC